MCMTSQPSGFTPQAQPIGQLLRSSPVLSGECERRVVCSYFVSSGFTSELVLGMPYSGSAPTSKPGRPQIYILNQIELSGAVTAARSAAGRPACN